MKDSVDKIIKTYFACVTSEPFTYKKKLYEPKTLKVGQNLMRGYTCPESCGGCCQDITLDYLPADVPKSLKKKLDIRYIIVNNEPRKIYSDLQLDPVREGRCGQLNMENARCLIHKDRPFSCRFELSRFLQFKERPNRFLTRLYGRGWNLKRVDGERGALCEILPCTPEVVEEITTNLKKLKDWADYFGLKTCLPSILTWIETGGYLAGELVTNSGGHSSVNFFEVNSDDSLIMIGGKDAKK